MQREDVKVFPYFWYFSKGQAPSALSSVGRGQFERGV